MDKELLRKIDVIDRLALPKSWKPGTIVRFRSVLEFMAYAYKNNIAFKYLTKPFSEDYDFEIYEDSPYVIEVLDTDCSYCDEGEDAPLIITELDGIYVTVTNMDTDESFSCLGAFLIEIPEQDIKEMLRFLRKLGASYSQYINSKSR